MLSLKNLPVRVSSILCGWIISICAIGITEPAEASVHRTASEPRALQDTSYSKVDVMPSPKDGMKAFYQFIGQHYRLPKEAVQAGKGRKGGVEGKSEGRGRPGVSLKKIRRR